MKKILSGLILIVAISSCSTQKPKEDEVKNLVKLWYEQQNASDGEGNSEVNGVTVLSVKKDKERKEVFNTTSLVTGIRKFRKPAQTWIEPKPDAKFSDTLRMNLQWNGAKWVTAQ
jgi:hypothetical protein